MKEIKYIGVALCLLLITTLPAMAQNGLYLSTGASVILTPGSKLSLDSLVLVPSSSLTLTGPVIQTRDTIIMHPGLTSYIKRVYNFSNTIPSFTGAITMYYRNNELNNLNENSLTLNTNDNTNWHAYTSNVTRDTANNFVTTSGLSNIPLRELTLSGTSGTLAVSIILLNVVYNSDNVNINWQTASEVNTSYFNIQRSNNGVHFNTINKTTAAGNSASIKNYRYTDINAASLHSDKLYYRLQEVDKDGKSTYSNVQVIDFKSNALFSISPNPAKDHINITSSANVSDAQIIITSANGRTLFTTKHSFTSGEQLNIPVEAFANQTLFITITTSNGKQQFKVVKE